MAANPNPNYLKTSNERINFIANISLVPCIICFLAFTRSFMYRFFHTGGKFVGFGNQLVYAKNCTEYAWLSNGAFEVVCNHKPLDFHAIFAIAWLMTFTIQVLLIKAKLRGFHKVSGKVGAGLGVVNVVGMIQLSLWDWFYPMENTARPPMFTPFMWFICAETLYCLYKGMVAIQNKKLDDHALWIFRAFIKTFSTPLIRFYPLVLRYFFGSDCMAKNRDSFVISAMTVAGVICTYFYYVSNKYVSKTMWDTFMKLAMVKLVLIAAADVYSYKSHGSFFVDMYQCWLEGAPLITLGGAHPGLTAEL